MAFDDDWRLTWEADWMYGAHFQWRRFTQPTEDWDHEHCALCWAEFMERPAQDTLPQGFVYGYDRSSRPTPLAERETLTTAGRVVRSPTDEMWVCPTCFEDFKERFGWTADDCSAPGGRVSS